MSEKLPQMSLRDGLQLWREQQQVQAKESHIPSELLDGMAQPGGLEHTDEKYIEHLASCSLCLGKWSAACRKNEQGMRTDDAADDWYSGGMLEAASSEVTGQPVSLPSRCGNFLLRLLPERGHAERGMVVVEVTGGLKAKFENCLVNIQDSQGRQMLEGIVTGGRVARRVDAMDEFDMQTWSMVVKFKNVNGK